MATIVVAERNEVMARGIASLLQKADCTLIGVCTSEDELLTLVNSITPDLILFGRRILCSHLLFEAIFKATPAARGIVIREAVDAAEIFSLASQGVIGILHADAGFAKYRACLGSVREGCQWIDPDFLRVLLQPPEKRMNDLTAREAEITEMVQRGWRNKQIARGLQITEGTVKMHLHHIFSKLGVATRTEVALRVANWHPPAEPPICAPISHAVIEAGNTRTCDLSYIAP